MSAADSIAVTRHRDRHHGTWHGYGIAWSGIACFDVVVIVVDSDMQWESGIVLSDLFSQVAGVSVATGRLGG